MIWQNSLKESLYGLEEEIKCGLKFILRKKTHINIDFPRLLYAVNQMNVKKHMRASLVHQS